MWPLFFSMTALRRNTERMASKEFDLVVIGAGINGAAIAWDAAERGLSVALIDKSDFGAGTSQGSFKIIHGGLRYLQHLDFSRLRESVVEQRTLRHIAPHLIHPLPFLVPCYGYGKRSKLLLDFALSAYELLAYDRNRDLDRHHVLPRHRMLSREECLRVAPGLNTKGLTGGVVYHDCQMSSCDRLTLAVVQSAQRAGAEVGNYLQATGFSLSQSEGKGRSIEAVQVRDLLSGHDYVVKTHAVINAAGPWYRSVLGLATGEEERSLFLKGVQFIVPQVLPDYAVALESEHIDPDAVVGRGGRSYFIAPWRGHTLIGTGDVVEECSPDQFSISKDEVESLLDEVSQLYNSAILQPSSLRFAFGGLRPVDATSAALFAQGKPVDAGQASVRRDDLLLDHAEGGSETKLHNFLSVEGVKYTTFRLLAEQTIDALLAQQARRQRIRKNLAPCCSANKRLIGGEIDDFLKFRSHLASSHSDIAESTIDYLAKNFGDRATSILDSFKEKPELAQAIVPSLEVTRGEIEFVVENEMVGHLSDVVMRRTGLGTLGYPGRHALDVVGKIVGDRLGWSAEQLEHEVRETEEDFFLKPTERQAA